MILLCSVDFREKRSAEFRKVYIALRIAPTEIALSSSRTRNILGERIQWKSKHNFQSEKA